MILIDSGIDLTHPEFITNSINVMLQSTSENNHGTEVASLITGYNLSSNNNTSLDFYPLELLSESLTDIKSSRASNQQKCEILVCPWQIENINNSIESLFLEILNLNTIVVVAIGNSGLKGDLHFPATLSHPNLIKVGSHDKNFLISKFNTISRDKTFADVYALGRKVIVASIDHSYREATGTSYSCAYVASELYTYLQDTAKKTIDLFFDSIEQDTLCWKYEQFKHKKTYNLVKTKKIEKQFPTVVKTDNLGLYNSSEKSLLTYSQEVTHSTFNNKIQDILCSIEESIVVPMSGGLDSEWIAHSLLANQVSFTPVIMRYEIENHYMNQYDYEYAETFCSRHNLVPTYIDLDVLDFFQSGLFYEYAFTYYCNSPQLCCHLWLLDQIGGFAILPGDPLREFKEGQYTWPDPKAYCYDYYFHKNSRKGIARLHLYDYETAVLGANLYQDAKKDYKADHEGLINETFYYMVKQAFYRKCGMRFETRPKKYTGFEEIKNWFAIKYGSYRYFDCRFRNTIKHAS